MENFTLDSHESRTILTKSSFSSAASVLVNVHSGPRAVVSLDIEAIDGEASVEVKIEDAFDTDAGFEEVVTFSRDTVGRTDQVMSDYHSQLKITATVTGGNATFRVGITAFELGAGPESSLPPGASTEATLIEVRDRLANIQGYVDGLEALTQQVIDASEAIGDSVDGLEGLATALNTYVDGLEPLITALNGYADGLEALITAGNASLASIDAGVPNALGQTTSANSMPVVLSSDHSHIPVKNFDDFTGAIAAALNSELIYDNVYGFNSIGATITPPTGGTVEIQGSFDGVTYTPITMRSVNSNEYLNRVTSSDSVLGSISTLRKIKWKVVVAGSAAGSITGRTQQAQATLEGQEHGYPPHKRGFIPIKKDFQFTTAQTGTSVWTPATGKKFIITSCLIFASGTVDADVSIFDQTDAAGNRLIKGFFDVSVNAPIVIPYYVGDSPFISSAAGNALKITTSADIDIFGILTGYEVAE